MDYIKIKTEMENAKKAIEGSSLSEEEKQSALSKLMDKIIENNSEKGGKPMNKPTSRKSPKKTVKKYDDSTIQVDSEKDELVNSLSRSEHNILYKMEKALDQALYLIKKAEEEKEIKGLTPTQISKILKEVFKINKSHHAISMALMKAVTYTDRNKIVVRGSPAYKYIIMHKGEEYLKKTIKEIEESNQEKI